jgi:hypothetical protein
MKGIGTKGKMVAVGRRMGMACLAAPNSDPPKRRPHVLGVRHIGHAYVAYVTNSDHPVSASAVLINIVYHTNAHSLMLF